MNFLADLADRVGYSAVNTARSALSSIITLSDGSVFGKHPLVKRLLKGVFEKTPSMPRYSGIWNVNIVLRYLKHLPSYDEITLKDITLKITMLLALCTGQRCQTLNLLKSSNLQMTEEQCTFFITDLLKQSRPGKHVDPIVSHVYSDDPTLCIVTCIKHYVNRTQLLRQPGDDGFLISFNKPHKSVSKDTIARWIKWVLNNAGIDITIYGAHSTRAASSSAVHRSGVPITDIMKSAGWSNDKTFAKCYRLPLDNSCIYMDSVLKSEGQF